MASRILLVLLVAVGSMWPWPAAAGPRVIHREAFSDLGVWEKRSSPNASLTFSDRAEDGSKGLVMDFSFKEDKGWAVCRRELQLTLPQNFLVKVRFRGKGGPAHLTVTLADDKRVAFRAWRVGLVRDGDWHDLLLYGDQFKAGWSPKRIVKARSLALDIHPMVAGSGRVQVESITIYEPEPAGKLRLARILTDHMVLQKGANVPVWGFAETGTEVQVEFAGKKAKTQAVDGAWQVEFPAMGYGGPHILEVTAGGEEVIASDIMVGEVWLVSGQSNMQWPLAMAKDAVRLIGEALQFPDVRLMKLRLMTAKKPLADLAHCAEHTWRQATPVEAAGSSAVGYLFARELSRLHPGVTIGFIQGAKGGSKIQPWLIPGRAENRIPRLAAERQLGNRYDAMIHPLNRLPLAGIVWYQGESNEGDSGFYGDMLQELIGGWREARGEDTPFITVQLPNFKERLAGPEYSEWAMLREAQTRSLALPKTALVSLIDAGEAHSIHPVDKLLPARRLAQTAQRLVYAQDVVCSGPTFGGMTRQGNQLLLSFRNVAGGLVLKDGTQAFAIAGRDRVFRWARARQQGDQVIVWHDEILQPVALRYAWADNPPSVLYNKAGHPAPPFRTDGWDPRVLVAGVETVLSSFSQPYSWRRQTSRGSTVKVSTLRKGAYRHKALQFGYELAAAGSLTIG
ncbi:MAG: hypothetical protein HN904_23500, partial [Victivallales bacterium]|nr:hypothetical protein [Victivallales bacterium]